MTKRHQPHRPISTFAIVARDPDNGDLGVAVQSKFLAVGAVVPWARAGVGAVATQSWANTAYGPEALRLLSAGWTAQETLDHLVRMDSAWAGHLVGEGYACQGNILVSEDTVRAMAEAFESTSGPLADRLMAALAAGQAAGGDSRGQQSPALLVVRTAGGYDGRNDRFIDLRVDDHSQPIAELARILELHKLYLFKSTPEELIEVDEKTARELQIILQKTGHYHGEITSIYDEATKEGLRALYGIENLEERWHGTLIDAVALKFLRRRFGE